MSLLPETASFEERVQDHFLALRGRGLSLSALDRELLAAWAAAEVPFEVVARGLQRAAQTAFFHAPPGEPLLRSLRACRRQVEAEIRKHQRTSAGRSKRSAAPTRWEEARLAALRAELAAAVVARPELGGAASRIAAGLLRAAASSPAEASRQEDGLHMLLCRSLPLAERCALWRQARQSLGDAEGLTPGARRLSRRVRLGALVRRALGLKRR